MQKQCESKHPRFPETAIQGSKTKQNWHDPNSTPQLLLWLLTAPGLFWSPQFFMEQSIICNTVNWKFDNWIWQIWCFLGRDQYWPQSMCARYSVQGKGSGSVLFISRRKREKGQSKWSKGCLEMWEWCEQTIINTALLPQSQIFQNVFFSATDHKYLCVTPT